MKRPKTETVLALIAIAATAYLSAHKLVQPVTQAVATIPVPIQRMRSRSWPFFVRLLLTVSILSALAVDFAILSRV